MDGVTENMEGSGTPASPRWNPTKEQISVLESLYKQGIRTPSADQIQEITSRLKVYGHIEGKNVFYWFQNHKARQRQKQKQETLAYYTRFLHKPTPHLLPTPCPSVVCGPFYLPQSDLGYYPQCPKVLLPGGVRKKSRSSEKVEKMSCGGSQATGENSNQETLPLFPLHPTGILQGRSGSSSDLLESRADNCLSETTGSSTQPFDFFYGRESIN